MAEKRVRMSEETRWAIFARGDYKCERCLKDVYGAGAPLTVHHRLPRQMGGTRGKEIHATANLLLLCGSGTSGCHGWVESNREMARQLGYLIFRIDNAEDIPYVDSDNKTWFLDNNGQKTQLVAKHDK